MNAAGWIFMLASWGVILGLFGYSMTRTLTSKRSEDSSE
jgi:hypothetical protein